MPLYTTTPALKTATWKQYVAGETGPVLTPDAVWNAGTEYALPFAATMTIDLGQFINVKIGPTANFVLANPINAKAGQTGRIRIVQDATGGRTISYGSAWVKAASDSGALSTAPNANDFLYYDVVASNYIIYTIRRGVA